MGRMKDYIIEQQEKQDTICDTCFDTKEVSTIEIVGNDDHGMVFEEGNKKVPCPDCCKDYYKENHEDTESQYENERDNNL